MSTKDKPMSNPTGSGTVVIGHVRTTREVDATLIESDIEWDDRRFPLWIRIPGRVSHNDSFADIFVPLAIFPALRGGGVLRSTDPISPMLAASVAEIQTIMTAWYPGDFRRFALEAPLRHGDPRPHDGVASCFTGGVDSFHTLARNRGDITSLVFARGLDIPLEERDFFHMVSSRLREAAHGLSLPLLEPESNFRSILDASGLWLEHTHGAAIASNALALAPQHFSKLYIPSTQSYRYIGPLGSHPMLDSLWSTEYLRIDHDSFGVDRAHKTAEIAHSEDARRYLRVCWESRSGYNCGVCEKCTRTMIGLELAGVLDRFGTFPDTLDLHRVETMRLSDESKIDMVQDSLDIARERPGNEDLVAALELAIARGRAHIRTQKFSDLARLNSHADERSFAIDELWKHSTKEMVRRMPRAIASKFKR